MTKLSAGVLLFNERADGLHMLLVHPGGPFWARRDLGAWSIPKGEYTPDEIPEQAARRELAEETGLSLTADLISLGEVRQPSGKVVSAFAARSGFDPADLHDCQPACGLDWVVAGRRLATRCARSASRSSMML